MIGFTTFPCIATKNLMLRKICHNDINDLYEMRSNPRMIEYTDSKLDKDINETRAYIDRMNKGIDENKWIIWAIEDKQTARVIGTISIWNFNLEEMSGELGYGIIPDYQGRGLMKEALLSVINYAFDVLALKVLDAYTEEKNNRSASLLKRCYFNEAGRVDDEGYFCNRIYHMIIYRLMNTNKQVKRIDKNNA